MNIAVITDDGNTISMHFGRAATYAVFTVEDGRIVNKELRDKPGHHQFAHEHEHEHEHKHEHEHEHGAQGHGFGEHSNTKHARMAAVIQDCEALIVRGMGRGAYQAMEQAGIRPVVTDIANAEEAVLTYCAGRLVDHTERLH